MTLAERLSLPGARHLLPPMHAPVGIRLAGLALVAGAVAYTASTLTGRGAEPLWDAWLYNSLTVLAAVIVLARAWLVQVERPAWLLLGLGIACTACGDILYSVLVSGQDPEPFPTIADVPYLCLYPCSYAAVVLLLRARLKRFRASVWLDGLTAGLGITAVTAGLAFGPILAATEGSPLAVAAGLAYPLGDLVLLAAAVGALALLGWRAEQHLWLLVGGFIVFGAADTAYLMQVANERYAEGTLLDSAWAGAVVLMAVAAWRPSRRLADRRLTGWAVLGVPMMALLLATGLLATASVTALDIPALATALSVATVVSVAVRLALTHRETLRLGDSRRLALTDDLTGVANRRALLGRLAALPPGQPVGLLLLDLDRFKEVNDGLGHAVGDELLRQLGPRLRAALRPDDMLARLGGDEFAVLLADGSGAQAAQEVAGRLVAALAAPFALDDISLHVEASVGIALLPEHTDSPGLLLQRADVAMYTAKTARSRIAVYRYSDDPYSRARLQTVEELRGALNRGELVCHYQPKVDVRSGTVPGVEALVRWQHPQQGLLAPDSFLPLAERAGLMRPLTLAVLAMALTQLKAWRRAGRELTVAVNLSTTNLLDVDLPDEVGRLLVAHDLPARALQLEITESVLMADPERAHAVVAALRALGVAVSIDDYGTGYSSLIHLKHLTIDELKIDRSFVTDLARDPRAAAIVRSTIDLGHALGLTLVAEGVEDGVTLDLLSSFGCDQTQGYLHSRPLPARELLIWLDTRALAPPGWPPPPQRRPLASAS